MNEPGKINYLEFPAKDLAATKTFFEAAFGWSFEDFGPEYTAFSNAGIDGGFFKSVKSASTDAGSALAVFYSDNLEQTQSTIEKVGGSILKPTYSFPGGRRFHFCDPNGNEFAVWSDNDPTPAPG
ncbi:VOC family protein [bacterium]|nr:VOC family protein [bacterium]